MILIEQCEGESKQYKMLLREVVKKNDIFAVSGQPKQSGRVDFQRSNQMKKRLRGEGG